MPAATEVCGLALVDTGAGATAVDRARVADALAAPEHEPFELHGMSPGPNPWDRPVAGLVPGTIVEIGITSLHVFRSVHVAAHHMPQRLRDNGVVAVLGMSVLEHCCMTWHGPRRELTLEVAAT